MATTVAWTTLIAALGAATITFIGTAFTQRKADSRAAQERAEAREQEKLRRLQETFNRTREDRKKAYLEFLATMARYYKMHDDEKAKYEGDWENEDFEGALRAFYQVQLYGTREAEKVAESVLDAMLACLREGGPRTGDERTKFFAVMRRDLDIPDRVPAAD